MSIKRTILAKSAKSKTPASGVFELTPRCNMNCKMCYIRMTEEEMKPIGKELNAQEWKAIYDQADKQGLLYLLFTGGEVFLRPDFEEIYSYAYKNGSVLSINTNGTMITEKNVQMLESMPPEHINLTLYGSNDEVYGELCSNPHGYSQLMRTLAMLREAKIRYVLNCSVTQKNIGDLDNMIKCANENGAELNIATYMFPPVRKSDSCQTYENIRLSPEMSGEVLAYLNCKQKKDRVLAALEACEQMKPADDEITCPDTGMECLAGRASYWITWYGKMKACAMFGEEYSLDNGFENAWKRISERADEIKLPGKCQICPKKAFCRSCAAVNFAETGEYDKIPDIMCQITDSYISNAKKILNIR